MCSTSPDRDWIVSMGEEKAPRAIEGGPMRKRSPNCLCTRRPRIWIHRTSRRVAHVWEGGPNYLHGGRPKTARGVARGVFVKGDRESEATARSACVKTKLELSLWMGAKKLKTVVEWKSEGKAWDIFVDRDRKSSATAGFEDQECEAIEANQSARAKRSESREFEVTAGKPSSLLR